MDFILKLLMNLRCTPISLDIVAFVQTQAEQARRWFIEGVGLENNKVRLHNK